MWPSVRNDWVKLNTPLEGDLAYMYLDSLGYVTTGMGDLIDPVNMALPLPWVNADGSPTSQADIQAAWELVDSQRSDPKGQRQTSGLATQYGQAFAGLTSLYLPASAITTLVDQMLNVDETQIKRYFPAWETWPADGQAGVLFMAWAMGSGFPSTFPQFTAALQESPPNFRKVLDENLYVFRGSGVQTRINDIAVLFSNADRVQSSGFPFGTLYYPDQVSGYSAARLTELALAGLGLGGAALYLVRPDLAIQIGKSVWSFVKGWLS
jgi:hypothetical protein